jgi:chaperonin GroEL
VYNPHSSLVTYHHKDKSFLKHAHPVNFIGGWMPHPRLALAPAAQQALQRGFNQLADLMEVALGPRGRLVAVASANPRKPPELLTDGATIARRFLGLPNRFETMGAFLARQIAWRMEESVGDGATTAVVIARQVLNESARLVAAGYNVMPLRRGLERALPLVLAALHAQRQPLDQPAQIIALATTITRDETIGRYIEEIFDTVGPYGAVDVRTHYGRGHDRQYIPGTFWNQGWVSSYFTTEGGTALLKDPYLLLTNRHLHSGRELAPILEKVHAATGNQRGLVVIAASIDDDALNILVTNKTRGVLPTLAIKAPGLGPEKSDIVQDLATLTGGKAFFEEQGEALETADLADLGQADEVQAIRSGFTLIGGKGRPAAIRQRTQELRARIPNAPPGRERDRLVERAGKLLGGVGLLKVGAPTEVEQEYLKTQDKEAVQVVRLALQDGVVPGGGVAFLHCLPVLEQLHLTEEEQPACLIMRSALLAPLQAILRNAGYAPAPILAQIQARGNGAGFDVVTGQIVEDLATQICDPLKVLTTALQTGVSGALMAMTTEVLVHKPRQNRDDDVDFNP